ncbi:hypothetical protein ASPVEDRAFT_624896 [Aspergillus versicolor CBS 583.65]|uniref:Uncharacterized protein n=1 Tax=Aspergillus versicolor CBS 583.65 TaxID=1036611 RepID=A0A1L9PI94_ASPVE|nr:uncharacterized protein ASPVEDRAFT_624896 [Aspergillus versicolor CBS 583.65]OJJ01260.1 hypothetical protein ASPVEDRAFT_624896 [Aspergillus versicolor CBS 583.65]
MVGVLGQVSLLGILGDKAERSCGRCLARKWTPERCSSVTMKPCLTLGNGCSVQAPNMIDRIVSLSPKEVRITVDWGLGGRNVPKRPVGGTIEERRRKLAECVSREQQRQ